MTDPVLSAVLFLSTLQPQRVAMVGSTYTIGSGNDHDLLVEVNSEHRFIEPLIEEGWDLDTTRKYADTKFTSLRKGKVNLLLTDDAEFYDGFLLAAEVCKALKLASRTDRVKVHQVILYGAKAEDLNAEALDPLE